MHYFIAASILGLTVLPALLSLTAGLGYNSALLPLRNWELLVFMIGATAAGSWHVFVGAVREPPRAHRDAPLQRQPRGVASTILRIAPWLFLMSAMLSTLASGADLYQFWSISFLALFLWLMLYRGLTRHVGAVREPPLLNAIQIAALLNAAMAFAQLFGFNPFFRPTTGGQFVTGLFDNPNRFGAFMAIALPLFFIPKFGGTGILPVLIGLTVLMSRSPFAILSMMAALGYYIICRGGPWWHRLPACAHGQGCPCHQYPPRAGLKPAPTLIAAAVAVILIFSVFLLDRPSRANLLRWEIAKKSVSIALERPILGHGLGQYAAAFNSRLPEVLDPPRRVIHAHNEYLELFVEQGLVGLAILGLFLLELFRRGGFITRPGQVSNLPLHASLIALMINALGFYPMRVPLIALSAAVILAGLTTEAFVGAHRDAPWAVREPPLQSRGMRHDMNFDKEIYG